MNCDKRGFTLIEVMVAMTLLGVITVLLASGTRLGIDLSSRGNAKADAARITEIERDLVRRQLAGAMPFRYWSLVDDKRVQFVGFEGTSDHIHFVSRYGLNDGPNSFPRWIDIRRTDAGGTGTLVVEERHILSPDNQPSETPAFRTQLGFCAAARFEYLDTAGEKRQWKSTWNPVETAVPLPSAVRIQCETSATPPVLLVPLDYAESAAQGAWFE